MEMHEGGETIEGMKSTRKWEIGNKNERWVQNTFLENGEDLKGRCERL